MLCILTNERVLCMPFAGRNQFFDSKTTFCVLLSHNIYKITQKISKNPGFKGDLPLFTSQLTVLNNYLCELDTFLRVLITCYKLHVMNFISSSA